MSEENNIQLSYYTNLLAGKGSISWEILRTTEKMILNYSKSNIYETIN